MDLNDFSDKPSDRRENHVLKDIAAAIPSSQSNPKKKEEYNAALTQWTVFGPNEYLPVAQTRTSLPAGVYNAVPTQSGIIFRQIDVKVDDLMEIPDSLHESVLKEIDDFWTRGSKFKEFGFLHRRGYLLYGPQGSGKTAIVQQVIARIVKSGDVVMLCDHPGTLTEGLVLFRQVEPKRRIVCVFEDIDSIVSDHGEDRLLALLDGENQVDQVLNIATTNYPERLNKRLIARPRRFDRVIKVGMPNANVRRVYLQAKIGKSITLDELELWIKQTDGLSFAAMAELVISVFCLGNKFEDTVKILRAMNGKASSAEFDERKIGMRPTHESPDEAGL